MRVTFEEWFEKIYPYGFYTNNPYDEVWWDKELTIRFHMKQAWDARYETLTYHDLTFHDYNDI